MESLLGNICDHLGPEQLEIPDDMSGCPYRKGLWLWKRLQVRNSNTEDRKSFESTLSTVQRKIWSLLDDWWNGRYHDMKIDDDDQTLHLIQAEEQRQEDANPDPAKLNYYSFLPYLFVAEMVWGLRIGQLKDLPAESSPRVEAIIRQINDKVNLARKKALQHAVWQMIAHSCYKDVEDTAPPGPDKRSMGSTLI
jgi:hypothetical protein